MVLSRPRAHCSVLLSVLPFSKNWFCAQIDFPLGYKMVANRNWVCILPQSHPGKEKKSFLSLKNPECLFDMIITLPMIREMELLGWAEAMEVGMGSNPPKLHGCYTVCVCVGCHTKLEEHLRALGMGMSVHQTYKFVRCQAA